MPFQTALFAHGLKFIKVCLNITGKNEADSFWVNDIFLSLLLLLHCAIKKQVIVMLLPIIAS
jgi:hypothetical protein